MRLIFTKQAFRIISFPFRPSFPLSPFLLLSPLFGLRVVKVLALLGRELYASVVRQQCAESLSARRCVGLLAEPSEPARAATTASGVAVLFCVGPSNVEVPRGRVASDIDYATPLGSKSGAVACGTSSGSSPSAPASSL